MKRYGGLPGAGAPLHDEDPRKLGPDNLILFRLDRGDDVTHKTGARPAECGEQCTRANQARLGRGEAINVEHFVVDADETVLFCREVPATLEPQGIAAGCPVERLGNRCPPVEDDRILGAVRHRKTADIEALATIGTFHSFVVDTSENQ